MSITNLIKTKIMKSIKHNIKALILIMGLALCIGLVFSLLSYYGSPAKAEERYMNAVELKKRTEEEAKAMIEDAERVRCLAEVDLATKKVKAFYDDERELEDGEDLQKLVSKTMQNCADLGETMQTKENPDIPKTETTEQGNFSKPDGLGIDAFLAKNGAEFVKDAGDVFRQVGEAHKIKPEVMVCIAQADSSLGKALKTSFNIGNVHNNDRGDTKHYPNLRAGIEAMAETLNNQYLGSHTTIGQLSRGGGNKTGKIYASSAFNWNKNVKACLRTITGDSSIDESFQFRI